MSLPVTQEERDQLAATQAVAGFTDNVVSTACPNCGVRFAVLAKLSSDGWRLRCTLCGCTPRGELREAGENG